MNELSSYSWRQSVLPALSLFGSLSTLICCALPALLVTLGAGAALAGLVSSAPWLITFSQYKVWVFVVSGIFLVLTGFMLYRTRLMACPSDPSKALACKRLRRFNLYAYFFSVVVWAIGFFFAFFAIYFL